MILCPYCDYENIEGADLCASCEQPINDQHLFVPATAVEKGLLRDRVRSLAERAPVTVSPSTTLREVLQTLVEMRIGCVIVTERGKVVGIFSERDALTRVGPDATKLCDRPISEFMTRSVQTLDPKAKIAFAVHRMDLGGFRHVPIVDDQNRPMAIISARDILGYLTSRLAER